MTQIVILGQPNGWHVRTLAEKAKELGLSAHVVDFRKLHAHLGTQPPTLQLDEFNLLEADRVLVRTVPPGSLEQIVFRMDALHRLLAAGIAVLNPPAAIEACVDKYLACARLQAAGLPIPRTAVCEGLDQAMEAFFQLGQDVVVKPLFGSEGRGIFRIDNEPLAYRVLRTLSTLQSVLYLQEFISHPGYDVRCLVLGDRVLATMRRYQNGDFRTNAALGGRVEAWEPPSDWRELAIRAARAVGAPLAGVDLITGPSGQPVVIEVNSTPGFQSLSETTTVDLAGEILKFLAAGQW